MRGILFLAVLTVKSSYSRDIELSVEGLNDVPDTLQWWFGANGCWRIHTYALDHDIHAYQIGNSPQTTLELAKQNNQKNYGDVIAAQHVIHLRIVPIAESWKLNLGVLASFQGSKLMLTTGGLHSGSPTTRCIRPSPPRRSGAAICPYGKVYLINAQNRTSRFLSFR